MGVGVAVWFICPPSPFPPHHFNVLFALSVLCSKRLGPLKSNLIPDEELPAPANYLVNNDELHVDFVEGRWLEVEYSQGGRYYGWKPASEHRDGKWVVNMPAPGDWTLNVRYQHTKDAPSFRIIVQGVYVFVAWTGCCCCVVDGDSDEVGLSGLTALPLPLPAVCTQNSSFPHPYLRSLVSVWYLPTPPSK